jgi:ABC-type branched-subunit amino acid transport system substrate-binding protein
MRRATPTLVLLALALIGTACAVRPPRVARIALVAPFEGRHRQVGYDAFPAVRLAVRKAVMLHPNASTQIEFIAYNDDGDPAKARRVARNVALDPQVIAVIGHLQLSTTLAALEVYTRAGLLVLTPNVPAHLLPEDPLVFRIGPSERAVRAVACVNCPIAAAPEPQMLPAAAAALADFTTLSLGPQPTARSVAAYDAAMVLLTAAHDASAVGALDRATLAQAVRHLRLAGLTGAIYFDEHSRWPDAPAYVSTFGEKLP